MRIINPATLIINTYLRIGNTSWLHSHEIQRRLITAIRILNILRALQCAGKEHRGRRPFVFEQLLQEVVEVFLGV